MYRFYIVYFLASIFIYNSVFMENIVIAVSLFAFLQIVTKVAFAYMYLDAYKLYDEVERREQNAKAIVLPIPNIKKYVSVVYDDQKRIQRRATIKECIQSATKTAVYIIFFFFSPFLIIYLIYAIF